MKLHQWFLQNKSALIWFAMGCVLVFLITSARDIRPMSLGMDLDGSVAQYATREMAMAPTASSGIAGKGFIASDSYNYGESVNPNVDSRRVVTESSLSLLVSDVKETMSGVEQAVMSSGGFVVNSSINRPEEGSSGQMSVRIPSEKLQETLEQLRSLSVRVVSENVWGRDITDQYSDLEAKLATLNKTKQRFEQIYDQANSVEEILKVQQSILATQDQIDAITGQLQYLENTSKTSMVSIFLSTDELSLPYAPAEPWRPEVVFKTAIRSLVTNARGIGSALIWVVVYSPVVIVIGLILFFIKKKMEASK